jgi:hypothetical protein
MILLYKKVITIKEETHIYQQAAIIQITIIQILTTITNK